MINLNFCRRSLLSLKVAFSFTLRVTIKSEVASLSIEDKFCKIFAIFVCVLFLQFLLGFLLYFYRICSFFNKIHPTNRINSIKLCQSNVDDFDAMTRKKWGGRRLMNVQISMSKFIFFLCLGEQRIIKFLTKQQEQQQKRKNQNKMKMARVLIN